MRTRALVGLLLLCDAIAAAAAPDPARPAVTPPLPPSASPAGSAGSAATPDPTSAASATAAPDPTSAGSATASADPSSSSTLAGGDGAAAVALRALARLDVAVSGTPRTFEAVLPARLTDASYGVKAAVCREGGYDLDAVAGRAVTFVGYDTTCSGDPRIAWAVVRGDAVACVYLSCTERDSSAAPGIWAARSCR